MGNDQRWLEYRRERDKKLAEHINARIYAEKMRRHAEEFRLYQANQGAI